MKQTPYDTGKVKIGLHYEPPRHNYMSADAERLQSALLRTPRRHLAHQLQELKPSLTETTYWLGCIGLILLVMYSPQIWPMLAPQ